MLEKSIFTSECVKGQNDRCVNPSQNEQRGARSQGARAGSVGVRQKPPNIMD